MEVSTPVKFIISPHRIQSLMCGVSRAELQGNRATLFYTDGSSESAICIPAEWAQARENFFSFVGTIQERARR